MYNKKLTLSNGVEIPQLGLLLKISSNIILQ